MYRTKIERKIKINTSLYFLLLIIMQLLVLKFDNNISYVAVFMTFKTKFIITPIITSIIGILFWMKVAEILEPAIGQSKIINYIGNNTYDIMLHHIFWIFALNIIILKISEIFNLSGFNVEKFKNNIYYFYTVGVSQAKIIYTIIIIAMPLIIRYMYENLRMKVKYKRSKLNDM